MTSCAARKRAKASVLQVRVIIRQTCLLSCAAVFYSDLLFWFVSRRKSGRYCDSSKRLACTRHNPVQCTRSTCNETLEDIVYSPEEMAVFSFMPTKIYFTVSFLLTARWGSVRFATPYRTLRFCLQQHRTAP